MTKLGDFIRTKRKEKKLSQRQLAKKIGVANSAISRWEKGDTDSMRKDNRLKLAEVLEVDPNSLFNTDNTDDLSRFDNVTPANNKKMVMVPVLGKIACGKPIFSEENIIDYVPTSQDRLPSGDNFWLDSVGDSMTPTIPQNSQVLIHKQSEVEDGEIAAVCINDELTLKRVKHVKGTVLLIPDNKDYDPIILNEESNAYIVGKLLEARQIF